MTARREVLREVFRELYGMYLSAREARKRYPRKHRQERLRRDILIMAADAARNDQPGLYGYGIMRATNLSSAQVYIALAALSNAGCLRRIDTPKMPRITYAIAQAGQAQLRKLQQG